MDKKLNEICKNLIPTQLINNHTVQYKLQNVRTQENTNIPYNWPAFLAVNNGYTSLYALIRIGY